jgi:hypothetical protein
VPDLRPFAVALFVGLAIAAFTLMWWHWPAAIGIGLGFVLGGLTLVGTISVGGDDAAADAAWRAAAPDLLEPRVGPVRPEDDPAGS